jgi:signal transduction histidine kinase
MIAFHGIQRSFMAEPNTDTTPKIPLPISKELRTLSHDLSNSIETIMQATYLLNQAKFDDANRKWLDLIDSATRDAAKINRQIRELLRAQSQES